MGSRIADRWTGVLAAAAHRAGRLVPDAWERPSPILFRAALAVGAAIWTGALTAAAGGFPTVPAVATMGAAAFYQALVLAAWAGRGRVPAGAPDEGVLEALADDAVLLRFEANGEAADVSDAARAVVGLAPELLLANGFFERLHVADRVVFLCAMADLRDGAARRRASLRLRLPRRPGEEGACYRAFSLDLLRTRSAAWPVAGLLRDDAPVRELRAERDAALAEAQAAERRGACLMAALGHEIRTPLNAVIGFADMLADERLGGFCDGRRKDYAGVIKASGEHLLRVAEATLEAGKLGAGGRALRPERFRLGPALDLCRAMLATEAARRGVRLVASADPGGEVTADRRVVQQILVNLLSNAVKFTPDGGQVTAAAERLPGGLRLVVGDTGAGIAEGDIERLGLPFTRLASANDVPGEGSGLGLSLVRELAAAHGGRLAVASRPGAGTVATVFLPQLACEAGEEEASAAAIGFERGGNGAIRKTG